MAIIGLLFTLSLFWLGLSGHYNLLFFGLGSFSILCVLVMKWRLTRVIPLRLTFLPTTRFRPLQLLKYFFWLLWQIVMSNFAVAKIILSPKMNLSPHFVTITAEQKTLIGTAIFANSITLTPGTLSVETIDRQHILIHALTKASGDIKSLDQMGARVSALEKNRGAQND